MIHIDRSSDNFEQGLLAFWTFYRKLQDQFLRMTRYIEFNEDNFHVYSLELLMLYQTICNEVEVVSKTLAGFTKAAADVDLERATFGDCWFYIQNKYQFHEHWKFSENDRLKDGVSLAKAEVKFLGVYPLRPFEKFHVVNATNERGYTFHQIQEGCVFPVWWSSHNKIKHRRVQIVNHSQSISFYKEANLINVAYAFAALYILDRIVLEQLGTRADLEGFKNTDKLFKKRSMAEVG